MSELPPQINKPQAANQANNSIPPLHIEGSDYKEPYSKRLKRYCNRNLRRVPVAIELFCGLALVVITATYTYYAGGQKEAMITQTGEMIQQTKIQVGVAHLVHGAPFVTPTPWMGVYDYNGQVRAVVNMYNQGRVFANSVQAAIKVDFLESPPTDYNFLDQDFQPVDPGTLPKFDPQTIPYDPNDKHPAKRVAEHATVTKFFPRIVPLAEGGKYAGKKIYVWGKIRYKDFTNDWAEPSKFCRVITIDDLFNQGSAIVRSDCSPKQ